MDRHPVEEEEIKKRNYGSPLQHDPQFAGPLTKRSCTDIICLLLFIAFIGGWVFVATFAYKHGDPERLIYPTDSLGQRCGVDDQVKDKPHLFFFDLLRCANPGVLATGCPTPQVCVAKCPEQDFSASYYLTVNKDLNLLKKQLICKYEVDVNAITSLDKASELIKDNKCAPWYIKSQAPPDIFISRSHPKIRNPLAGRCLPSVLLQTSEGIVNLVVNGQNYTGNGIPGSDVLNATKVLASLASLEEFGEMILQDLTTAWPLILAGLVEAMILCLIYIIIMRWLAAPMVWVSLIGSVGLLSYAIYACWERYNSLDSYKQSELPNPSIQDVFNGNLKSYLAVRETWLAFLIIAAVALVIVLLITIALRNRLRIAVALIREASKAVGSSMSTLFFPLIPWLLQLGVLAYGVSVMLYLASAGNPVYRIAGLNNDSSCVCPDNYKNGMICNPDAFKTDCYQKGVFPKTCLMTTCTFYAYRSEAHTNWFHAYNLLGLFWGLFFVSAFGEMVLAGTFATWYWTWSKKDLPFFTLTGAFLRTIRYHLGTLAFGSLIIALCRMVRVFLEWLDHKLKKYDNAFVRGILCCCKCCFWCLEKFLRFLNRNAYIMCAVHGKNFCASAKDAFFLLMRNVVRVVVLDKTTGFLLFLGKLLIITAMCVQWFYIFGNRWDAVKEYVPTLNYYMLPVIIIGIGTYFISSIFFGVYSIAVDTLFLCFLEDSERHDGSAEKPYFMSSKLMQILNKKNKNE